MTKYRLRLCGCYWFRATCEVVREYSDLRVGGLVYDTFVLVCAEFQRARFCESSHQSLRLWASDYFFILHQIEYS